MSKSKKGGKKGGNRNFRGNVPGDTRADRRRRLVEEHAKAAADDC